MSLPLAKCIVSIITNDRENWLKELKEHLRDRKHPQHIIDYSFTKIFYTKFQTENNDSITFMRTYNPSINLKNFHSWLGKIKNKGLKTCFQKKKVLLFTRQPPNLRTFLTITKFEKLPRPKQIKHVDLFFPRTSSIMKIVILKNVYLFRSNPKTNC